MARGMVYIGLSEEENLQLGFKLRQIGEILQTGRQVIQTAGVMKLIEHVQSHISHSLQRKHTNINNSEQS